LEKRDHSPENESVFARKQEVLAAILRRDWSQSPMRTREIFHGFKRMADFFRSSRENIKSLLAQLMASRSRVYGVRMGEAVHKSTLARKSNGELAEAASVGAHTQPEIGVRHSARKSADSGSHTLPKIDRLESRAYTGISGAERDFRRR
jgi:hypothetical protein